MFKVTGVTQMIQKLQRVAKQLPNRVADAAYAEAEIEVTEMKKRTPVDTRPNAPHPGNLRNSIHAERPIVRGRQIEVVIATGRQAPYAVFVHENPDAFHPIGEWKFMESVLNESRAYMGVRIARRLDLNRWRV